MIEVSRFVRRAAIVAALGAAMAVPASAGHEDKDEAAAPAVLADHLHHMGFTEWRSVRLHHGIWKVDDAQRANGHIYDLKVEDGSFDLVRLEREKPDR